MDGITRMAETRDAETVCQVLRRSITECCIEDHRGDPRLLVAWLSNKTYDNVLRWIESEGCHPVVAEVDGVLVGFASVLASGEIPLNYIVPEVRFTGVGKALLVRLETIARGLGLQELRLESTRTARVFYLRSGFGPSGSPVTAFGMVGYPMTKSLDRSASEDRAVD